jgi:cytochrome b561
MATTYAVPVQAYTPIARALHWTTAVLVFIIIPAGIAMVYAPAGPVQDTLFHIHRSTGALLIPVILVRAIYRATHKPLPLPADIPAPQRFVAETVHWLLYALLFIQPFLGWIATSAYRAPVLVYWTFELPPIWPEDRAFSEQLFELHEWIGFAIAALLCAHIGGALFHHFVRKDSVLLRMTGGA